MPPPFPALTSHGQVVNDTPMTAPLVDKAASSTRSSLGFLPGIKHGICELQRAVHARVNAGHSPDGEVLGSPRLQPIESFNPSSSMVSSGVPISKQPAATSAQGK